MFMDALSSSFHPDTNNIHRFSIGAHRKGRLRAWETVDKFTLIDLKRSGSCAPNTGGTVRWTMDEHA